MNKPTRANKNCRLRGGYFGDFCSAPSRITPTITMPGVKHLCAEEKAVIETHKIHGLTATGISKLNGRHRTNIVRHLRESRMNLAVAKCPKLKMSPSDWCERLFDTLPFVRRSRTQSKSYLNWILEFVASRKYWQKRHIWNSSSEMQPWMTYTKENTKNGRTTSTLEEEGMGINFFQRWKRSTSMSRWVSIPLTRSQDEKWDFSRRAVGRGSLKIWGAIYYRWLICLAKFDGHMNSERYFTILQNTLFPGADLKFSESGFLSNKTEPFTLPTSQSRDCTALRSTFWTVPPSPGPKYHWECLGTGGNGGVRSWETVRLRLRPRNCSVQSVGWT